MRSPDSVKTKIDETDKDFAEKIRSTLTENDIATVCHAIGMDPTDRPLADFLVPLDAKGNPQIGSTDVGDVAWVVPTVQVHAPTVAIGTPFHTWQVGGAGKSPGAHKAMMQAAKAMAGLGVKGRPEEAYRPHALCQPAAGQCCATAGHVPDLTLIAFSSEADPGSRKENASRQGTGEQIFRSPGRV